MWLYSSSRRATDGRFRRGRLAGELNSLIINGFHLSENVTKEREINDQELPANRPDAFAVGAFRCSDELNPPPPPFDIETMEPVEPPWQAIKEWIPDDEPDLTWFNQPRKPSEPDPDWSDQSPAWQAPEVPLGDGRTLILEYT
jgi:hypothetical protein